MGNIGKRVTSTLITGLALTPLHAQSLVRDIEPSTSVRKSEPELFVASGLRLFFKATTEAGTELWTSDGTAAGTAMVRDLVPGPGSGQPFGITDLDGTGRVAFTASGVDGRDGIWISDGTAAGTFLTRDLRPGFARANPGGLFRVGNRVMFFADDGVTGRELWITDGTVGGTTLVRDVRPGSASGCVHDVGIAVGGIGLFVASDGGPAGFEVWRSDGTAAGTSLLVDITPNGNSFVRFVPGASPGRVWIVASNQSTTEIWCTDGTVAGTTRVVDLSTIGSSTLHSAADLSGDLVFSYGRELWKVSPSGTLTALSFGGGFSDPFSLTSLGNRVVFTAETSAAGREVWVTDGTHIGTRMLRDVRAGVEDSGIDDFVVSSLGNEVFFAADDGVHGRELWATDGTMAGTRLVLDAAPGSPGSVVSELAPYGAGIVMRSGGQTTSADVEPWISNGTAGGTFQLADVARGAGESSNPLWLAGLRDRVYFFPTRSPAGNDLWSSDGTAAGTIVVHDLGPGSAPAGSSGYLRAWRGSLYFGASDAQGPGLWRSEGVPENGGQVAPPVKLFAGEVTSNLHEFGGELWFGGRSTGAGPEGLWSTDGTVAGTQLRIAAGAGSLLAAPSFLTQSGGLIYFSAGLQLWATDGNAATLRQLTDLPGMPGVAPQSMTPLAGGLFFTLTNAAHGNEPYWTDGTAAGTRLLRDIFPGVRGSGPAFAHGDGGQRVFFSARDAARGLELWVAEGSPVTVRRVVDLFPGSTGSNAFVLGQLGDRILFSAMGSAAEGVELWSTDGTALGTTLVRDLLPGRSGSLRNLLFPGTVIGNRMLFQADRTGDFDFELFVTDGTTAGTQLVADLNPFGPSRPLLFTRVGSEVYFQASEFFTGSELWKMSTDVIDAAFADDYGTGCAGSNGLPPRLETTAPPTLGAAAGFVELVDAAPSSMGAVLVGVARGQVPIGFGCSVLVDPAIADVRLTTAANGTATVPLAIPADPIFLHREVDLQPVVLDQGATWFGVASLGPGLALRIGR